MYFVLLWRRWHEVTVVDNSLSKTPSNNYPPSPYGYSLQRETKKQSYYDISKEKESSTKLSPFGGGSLKSGGGLNF
jgi:hypothetical protein